MIGAQFTRPKPGERTSFGGVPRGSEALILSALVEQLGDAIFIARDDVAMAQTSAALTFFSPKTIIYQLPAWDCLPYDRISPRTSIVGKRLECLGHLVNTKKQNKYVVLTTVSAVLQRLPEPNLLKSSTRSLALGDHVDSIELSQFLHSCGYRRAETVMEPGEFAVRGGIMDIFPPSTPAPLRLDFNGDELEALRAFNPETQRTQSGHKTISAITLSPVSEVLLTDDTISQFRSSYRAMFGVSGSDDPLYEAVSSGKRHTGMEHWLPLFHKKLVTLLDYLPRAQIVFDHDINEAQSSRLEQISEYHLARLEVAAIANSDTLIYRPISPETLFITEDEWQKLFSARSVFEISPFSEPDETTRKTQLGGTKSRNFADIRVQPTVNVYDATRDHLSGLIKTKRFVLIAAFTEGSCERMINVLREHGLSQICRVTSASELKYLQKGQVGITVLPMETGFNLGHISVVTEQDILGDRLGRPGHRRLKAKNFIAEVSSLASGDLVVHTEHGIAQFDGLQEIEVNGAPHDCLRLIYAAKDKLFLPVENIEVLTRYGSEDTNAQLDRLGSAAWQARRTKLKARVREMAAELIEIAAKRSFQKSEPLIAPTGLYEEFAARFPYDETDDQQRAIIDVLSDLGSGHPTDRLICGDVGFGKTEVALRAAFTVANHGKQVAVVTPTTLLCRQHFQVFKERFQDLPIRIEQLSRLVTPKRSRDIKKAISEGQVDIIIGTHALLAKDVQFQGLGLLVVDEEQHFGVAHKERLKKFRAGIHVLTLSATPIPRTLQQALTGIRDMSLIATPPVDRLAVRTFVLPFDPVIIREALLREKFRGGQSFYVCPRIADIARVEKNLRELTPELRLGVAHGQMSIKDLEFVVSAFYDGKFDVLLSTNIVESGLDLPSVNTIVIDRADMFGLAQLYQLRGRVGRSKLRAYAYMTLPPKQKITKSASRRLEVMQTLDNLGAGFSLASHDMDIRGAGNLLGDEQSGHIREVGVELYQKMLEEAVAEARGLNNNDHKLEPWSPQVSLGLEVMIPEAYVADLAVRMSLYRRAAELSKREEIDAFAAELIDRFGPLPDAVENLLQTLLIKALCRRAGVAKIDAGPKGAVISFFKDQFANPEGLIAWFADHLGTAKLRPDHKLVFMRKWTSPKERLTGTHYVITELVSLSEAA
ncbi:MAG: transcription-repair coupling factor [Rhodospirillaceae bacterium TMED8]|nr:transcription-repair coupling factor [Magnetovibrio sp.]OUT49517.1 MAG: transcription-repair coupling factor [Rhodospirillaceae bacterium TMED8]|tara:strand:- start:157 stop:3645 length:3489 start_codon:yes stop_codon:yes gene_type:complete